MTSERRVADRRGRPQRAAASKPEVIQVTKAPTGRSAQVLARAAEADRTQRPKTHVRGAPLGSGGVDRARGPELPPSALGSPAPAGAVALRSPERAGEARALGGAGALETPGARAPVGPGNFFGERDALPPVNLGQPHDNPSLVAAVRGWPPPEGARGTLDRPLVPRAWQLLDTRFSTAAERGPGDNRFVGIGEGTSWALHKAEAMLSAIAPGRFAEQLTVELVQQINATIRESSGKGGAASLAAGLRRQPVSRLAGPLSAEEIEHVVALGLAVHRPVDGAGGAVRLAPPGPERVPALLDALVAETRAALVDAHSQAAVVAVAERFARRLAAIEPFGAANELTARLFMDRILAERGLPPPVLEGRVPRLASSSEAAQTELVEGIARTNARCQEGLGTSEGFARALIPSLGEPGSGVPAPSPNRLVVRGVTYAQGVDGFLADPAGRPFLLEPPGTLRRVNQLLHAFVVRRARQADDPVKVLEGFTAQSRALFAALVKQPGAGEGVAVLPEKKILEAERAYRLELPASGNDALIALYDADATLTRERAFDPREQRERRPSAAFTSARYQQLDLEWWHVEDALRRGGDAAGAGKLRKDRERLFARAKEHFDRQRKGRDPSEPGAPGRVAEQVAIATSPLLNRTLREAESAVGDGTIHAYRSVSSAELLLGVDAHQEAGRADALTTWSRVAAAGAGPVIADELLHAGDARERGTGLLTLTSDATSATAPGRRASVTVEAAALPGRFGTVVTQALTKANGRGAEQPLSVALLQRLVDPSRPEAPPPGCVDVMTLTPASFERAARAALGTSAAALLVADFRRLRGRAERSVAERLATAIESGPRYLDVRQYFGTGDGKGLQREQAFLAELRRSADELPGAVLPDGRVRLDGQVLVAEVALPRAVVYPGASSLGGRPGEADQQLVSAKRIEPQEVLAAHRLDASPWQPL